MDILFKIRPWINTYIKKMRVYNAFSPCVEVKFTAEI